MAKPDVFARRIRALAESVTLNAADAKAAVALRAGRAVVRDTPVDSALARSNWVAAPGAPDLSIRPIRSREQTVNEIAQAVSMIDSETDIHIANGGEKVPYLILLDAGSSNQAPAGFVAESAQEGLRALRTVRLLKRRRR